MSQGKGGNNPKGGIPPKWNPFMDLLFLQGRAGRLFDDLMQRSCAGVSAGAWFPPVDIYETDGYIVLKAELPGVDNRHVSIEVDGNVLTLKGERRFEKTLSEENYHRMERFYGIFQRSFSLSNAVDKIGMKTQFKDGVLKITVPKAHEARHGAIKVKVS
ncbi:MAG: Hsp20/alpha crystallin family protein [Deltaproteobacteria bacterium]|nr:Hsp20/alpha crystallin family protein [Deltaproteobacteria bacterium]